MKLEPTPEPKRDHVIGFKLRPPASVTAVSLCCKVLDAAYPGSVARYDDNGDMVIERPDGSLDADFVEEFDEWLEGRRDRG